MVGGAITLKLAVAGLPVPPSLDATLPVVLFCAPAVVPVTLTENVHEPFPDKLAPDRLIVLVPCVAVMVPPPQEPVNPLGFEIARPEGRVSLNPTPVTPALLVFLTVNDKLVLPPVSGIEAAPNVLLTVGGAITVRLAEAVPPVPASFDVTLPVVLLYTPAAVPVTFTKTVHELPVVPPACRVNPDTLIELPPAAAVMVPPAQEPPNPLGVETARPAGRVSLNPTPVMGV
jgi:hypothetical protein